MAGVTYAAGIGANITTTTSGVSANQTTLDWDTADLNTLINNLAKCLPKNDVSKYSTLVEKLDWEKVRFGRYTAQECKDKWFQVMARVINLLLQSPNVALSNLSSFYSFDVIEL